MDKKIRNAIILVITVFVIVTIQQAILYSIDSSIGAGNVQVIVTDSQYNEQWTMGLIPQLETVSKAEALANGDKIWAAPGDYVGSAVIGITSAIAAVMWIVWLGVFLGFPGNIQLKKERIAGLVGITLLIIILNLVFLRAVADATVTGSVVKNTTGHLSLALNNTGILMAIIFHRLGVGVRNPGAPLMPALGGTGCARANAGFYKKFYGLMLVLVVTSLIEVAFQLANAAIPEVAVDASVWLIWGVIFIAHFGTYPSDWKLGKRPRGIVLMIVLTVLTIVGFYIMQIASNEAIGSGVGEQRLVDAGMSANAGLSLMMSCWLVFWIIALSAAGFCSAESSAATNEKKP
ncbi:MAG: hypothetical protein QW505_01940 [Thermoplasmata archaeon]